MIKQNWPRSFEVKLPQPLDAKTLFENLTDIDHPENGIPGNIRFKGQKFVIKNVIEDGKNVGPKEYWFTEDYQEAGDLNLYWIYDDNEKWFSENNILGKTRPELNNPTTINLMRAYLGLSAPQSTATWNSDWFGISASTWEERRDPPEFIPPPELYQPGGEVDLDEHNSDQTAHQPIRQLISDLDGETLVASKRDNFEYKNLNETPMTINQYADRAPNAWQGTGKQFGREVLSKLKDLTNENKRQLDGTYFVE